MDNMMQSLSQAMIDKAPAWGLDPADVELILYPGESGEDDGQGNDHRRTITVRHLRTMKPPDDEVAIGNLSEAWPGPIKARLSVIEILVACRPTADDKRHGKDYYHNEARQLAGLVESFLAGPDDAGLIVYRHAYEKPGEPIEGAGTMEWQRTDSQPETPGDPTRTMVLTYEMTWWAPLPT